MHVKLPLLIALGWGIAVGVAAAQQPATSSGSFGPDVYLDDITYTLRSTWFRAITVSRHDPNVAYLASYDGYVWKTIDGGRTWDESRLIVEPKGFFGDAWERLYFGVHRLGSGPIPPFSRRAVKPFGPHSGVSSTHGGAAGGGGADAARGAEANVNFGIGVPGGAPRLQLLVRKFGKPTSGLNIKQTLLLRGTRPLEVRIVEIHPHNPNIVFACTMFGLYKSYDGGLNWVRTFTGTSPMGWRVFHVAVDPRDDNKVLLASGEGLYVSTDGGENFSRSTSKGVGEGVVNWIYFNPHDSRYVFVGTDFGLLRSSDGGESWDWTYFTTFPDGRVVRGIVIDPFDKKTGYIATHDGLYYTKDLLAGGLESWERMGGLAFTGIETSKIEACPRHKGHLWTVTNTKLASPIVAGKLDSGGAFVYESLDGGETWKDIYAGNTTGSMQWFDMDPEDPDLLWLVWSRSLSRMRRRPANAPPGKRGVIPDDPPIGDVLVAALKYTGTDPAVQLGYRRRSLLKALVPRLDAQYLYWRWKDDDTLADRLYPTLPFLRDTGWRTHHKELRLLLTWDLSDLLFNLEASMFGRVDRLNYEIRSTVSHEVHRLYGELRRLRMLMANEPPEDLRVRVMYKVRMQELTAHMDFLTGNYLTRWQQGDHPRGRDTKWWEPWPVRRR